MAIIKIVFADFKDCAEKFDSKASIAFVANKTDVWVKTGSRDKSLCYKEDITSISGFTDEIEKVSFCLEHKAIKECLEARISGTGISNQITMLVDTEHSEVKFEIMHTLTTPATDKTPEKTEVLGTSRRGAYKMQTGVAPTHTMELDTCITDEIREANKDNITVVSCSTLADTLGKLGVVKLPVFITACEEGEGTSKAFVSDNLFGEMPITPFKRGVRISYDLVAPISRLLIKDGGNAECLARFDDKDKKIRVLSIQTASFFVSGVVEKVSAKSLNVLNLAEVTKLDYDKFKFSCCKILLTNITKSAQTVKITPNGALQIGDDTLMLKDFVKEGEVGDHIFALMQKGVRIDFTQFAKMLSAESGDVRFAIGEIQQNGGTMLVVRVLGTPSWYLPAKSV